VFINIISYDFCFSDVFLLSRMFSITSVSSFVRMSYVHVRDVDRAQPYIVIFVNRFKVSNEREYILLL
jgi:hypothetical protein